MTLAGLAPERLEVLAGQFGGVLVGPADATYDEAAALPQRPDRQAARARGALSRNRRRRRRRPLRRRRGPRARGPRRWAQRVRARRQRRRAHDRPVADAGRRGRPGARTARAQGGAPGREFNRETGAPRAGRHRRRVSTTGIAGLTLGGGLGWLMGKLRAGRRQPAVGRGGARVGRGRAAPSADAIPTCSGRCAAAAATSASSRRSSTALHPVGERPRRARRRTRSTAAPASARLLPRVRRRRVPTSSPRSPASCTRRMDRGCQARGASSSATPGRRRARRGRPRARSPVRLTGRWSSRPDALPGRSTRCSTAASRRARSTTGSRRFFCGLADGRRRDDRAFERPVADERRSCRALPRRGHARRPDGHGLPAQGAGLQPRSSRSVTDPADTDANSPGRARPSTRSSRTWPTAATELPRRRRRRRASDRPTAPITTRLVELKRRYDPDNLFRLNQNILPT